MLKLETRDDLEALHSGNVKESLHLEFKASQASSMKALGGVFDAANLSRRIGRHQLRGCLDRPTEHGGKVFPAIVGSARKIVLEIAQPPGARISGFVGRSAAHNPRVPAMLASAAVHSNKKTVVYTSFPGQPTSDARHSLQFAMDIWQRFQMPDTRAAAGRRKWIGIGGARLSLVCFRSA